MLAMVLVEGTVVGCPGVGVVVVVVGLGVGSNVVSGGLGLVQLSGRRMLVVLLVPVYLLAECLVGTGVHIVGVAVVGIGGAI